MRDRKTDMHRQAAARKLGRPLTADELVHHKDEDKTNNTSTNLDVTSRSVHTSEHNKARGTSRLRAALRMVKEGRKLY